MSIIDRITAAARAFMETPEPKPQADASGFGCPLCQDTGWAPCKCGGELCVCSNHGEMRCPRGCPEPMEGSADG